MTFIKLDEENFVSTKIINRFKVEYKESDSSTFLTDNNIDSKSILYSNESTHGTFSNDLIGLQDNNDLNDDVASFFNFANNKIDYKIDSSSEIRLKKNNYFDLKNSLITEHNVTNENLKKFNFKNYFKIERVVNSFLPSSFELSKFESVKNNLYDYYSEDFSKDFYPEVDYGFCNYNSINFFSQKYNTEKTHSNCLVYSNQKNSSNVNDVDFRNNFSLNVWINVRKNNSSNRGCLIHIPDLFSLYSIEEENSYRFCLTTGSDAKKTLNSTNFANIDFNNINSQFSTNICLTKSLEFSYNNWYNLTVNFDKINDNNYLITFYKDSTIISIFNLEVSGEKQAAFNSFICIGNKPYYYRDDLSTYNTEYEDIFYTFFGKNYMQGDISTNDGPFYLKDLNLGKNTSYNDSLFIDNIINSNNIIYFNDTLEKNSSFHGEIQELKIYSNTLNEDKIKDLYKKSVSEVSSEIENYNLSFYLPVYYLPLGVKKVGLFNCQLSDINLFYNCIYNPFFANSSLGRDLSIENYLVDFINSKKPNVVISGYKAVNIYENNYEKVHRDFIDNTTDILKIKKGRGSEDIFLDNLESLSNDSDNKYNNISYRNLLIMPNDNGIPRVSFDSISYFLENDTVYSKERDFFKTSTQEKLYHIDCYNTLNFTKYQKNDRLDGNRESISGKVIKLNTSDGVVEILSDKDMFFNLSNYFYHDNLISSVSDFSVDNSNLDSYIANSLDLFNKSYIDTKSNPVNRDYLSSTINFRTNDVLLNEDLSYRYLPVPYYSLNKNDLSLFSQIIDISTQYYNKKIKKGTLEIKNTNISGSNNNISISLSDNKKGHLYRNDCLTKVAEWNYVGHAFYKEGICAIHNTSLYSFGKTDFEVEFVSEGSMFVHETNIPIREGMLNVSHNTTYNKDFRIDESAFNSDEPFVFITDVNIHDENLNVVAKAKMAHPIPKKNTDNLLIRLKMDY